MFNRALVSATVLFICSHPSVVSAQEQPPAPHYKTNVVLDTTEAAKVLRGIAAEIQSNRQKVSTYVGTWECQDRNLVNADDLKKMVADSTSVSEASTYYRYVRAKVGIEYNAPLSKLRCDFEAFTSELRPTDGSTPVPTVGPLLKQISVVTGEEVYTFEPNVKHGQLIDPKTSAVPKGPQLRQFGRVAFREPIELQVKEQYGVIVNPLNLQRIGRDILEDIEVFAKMLADPVTYTAGEYNGIAVPKEAIGKTSADFLTFRELTDANDKKTWRLEFKGFTTGQQGGLDMTYEFDGRYRGQPVSVETRVNNKIRQSYVWGYDTRDGTIVPTKIAVIRFNAEGDRVTSQRILNSLEFVLNPEIPESSFTLQSLGLQEGERLVDRISGEILQQKSSKLVPYVTETTEAHDPANSGRAFALLIAINAVLIVIISVVFYVRKERAKAAGV